MRPIDWSPLVVLLAAIVAAAIASALPDTFFLKKETAAVIIWVPLVLAVLKAIRGFRQKRMAADKSASRQKDDGNDTPDNAN